MAATLLTVPEVREHIHSALADDALGRVVGAADNLIVSHVGQHAPTVAVTLPGSRFTLTLPRPATKITSADEWTTDPAVVTAATGHLLVDGGRGLRRTAAGDTRWASWVTVKYAAVDDRPLRKDVLLQLVRLDLADTGALFQSDGGYIQSSFGDRARERRRIVEPLVPRYGGAGLLA